MGKQPTRAGAWGNSRSAPIWAVGCKCPTAEKLSVPTRGNTFFADLSLQITTAAKKKKVAHAHARATHFYETPEPGTALPLGCNASRDARAVMGSRSLFFNRKHKRAFKVRHVRTCGCQIGAKSFSKASRSGLTTGLGAFMAPRNLNA